jgi:hypothetical protein
MAVDEKKAFAKYAWDVFSKDMDQRLAYVKEFWQDQFGIVLDSTKESFYAMDSIIAGYLHEWQERNPQLILKEESELPDSFQIEQQSLARDTALYAAEVFAHELKTTGEWKKYTSGFKMYLWAGYPMFEFETSYKNNQMEFLYRAVNAIGRYTSAGIEQRRDDDHKYFFFREALFSRINQYAVR